MKHCALLWRYRLLLRSADSFTFARLITPTSMCRMHLIYGRGMKNALSQNPVGAIQRRFIT